MANKTLTAKVKINTKSAEASLSRLIKKINAVQKAVDKANKNTKTLTNEIKKATKATDKLNKATNKVANTTNKVANTTRKVVTANDKATSSARKMSDAYRKSNSNANSLLGTVKRIASAYIGMQGIKLGIETSDTITSAENRLNNIEGGSEALTATSMDKMYAAAQRSRSSYSAMMGNVSKTMALAGDSFQGNIDNAIRFQEIMAKAYTIGGASATEASTSMYQLVQALGSGILQGDELRSVREGAPIAYKKIEEFAQGVFNTEESLKDLASQGVITSDIIVAAIMDAEKDITSSFENTKITFAQTWDKIKNMAIKAFEPALQKLNDLLNSDGCQKFIEGLGNALILLGTLLGWLFGVFATFFNWCSENWYWLEYVVIGIIGAIIAAIIMWTAITITNAVKQIVAWLAVHWQMALIFVMIAVLVGGIVWLANTTADGAEFICKALAMVALAFIVVGTIIALVTGSVTMLVVGVIIAAIAGIIALLAYCGEEVMGTIYVVGAFIYNLVVGLLDGILQLIWLAVDPIIGIVEFILNTCNGGFNSFGDAVANLIGQIIGWFLSLGKVVTKIIDAIFGTDWTSGLNDLKTSVEKWGKNENAITLNREAPTVSSIVGKLGLDLPDRIAYGDAYSKGAEVGANIENAIGSFGDTLKNGISSFADMGNLFGTDKFGKLPNPYDPALGLGNGYDPSGADNDIKDGLDKLNGTADDIKDSIDLRDDDLEFLRKIAEMEWRNEFTTAEIKIDMTNHNTVNGDRDLDGIVGYLSDVLREEMTSVAEGVHY